MKLANDTLVSHGTKRINAIHKHITAKTEIPINGQMMKPAAILALFQEDLDARALADTKRGEYKAAISRRTTVETTTLAADECLKSWVLSRFGKDSPEAHDFGYSARKVTSPSAATKATAVLLNLATRKARGTMGKKEKLKIKGTLDTSSEPAPAPLPIVNPPPAPAVTPPAPVAVVVPAAPSPALAPTNGASASLTNGAASPVLNGVNGVAH